ncbi:MAG: HAMP domain-containing histidine kinase, partial [Chloroflexi bacterium]|nr:HAMP domain-containing histidine kinase [Chloroflexota bacterium]
AANIELEKLSRAKDEFVSNVSHELRTPITGLIMRQYLLRRQPHNLEQHLGVIERETRRLEHTIEDLLRLSRLDQERVDVNLAPVDLNQLVEEYVFDRKMLAEQQGLTLSYAGQASLPPVLADAGLLGQALSIVLTNALNYTPPGGDVRIRTWTQHSEGQDWAGFSVSDTGPGIPPNEQDRLFERFFRGSVGRESQTPGTGLGLAIAKAIADRHNGHITVESEGIPGRGTTFSIWLPVEE